MTHRGRTKSADKKRPGYKTRQRKKNSDCLALMSRLPTRHKLDIRYASISGVADRSGEPDPIPQKMDPEPTLKKKPAADPTF